MPGDLRGQPLEFGSRLSFSQGFNGRLIDGHGALLLALQELVFRAFCADEKSLVEACSTPLWLPPSPPQGGRTRAAQVQPQDKSIQYNHDRREFMPGIDQSVSALVGEMAAARGGLSNHPLPASRLAAAARASSVIDAPDSMRAISSARCSGVMVATRVAILSEPSAAGPLEIRRCVAARAATCGAWVTERTCTVFDRRFSRWPSSPSWAASILPSAGQCPSLGGGSSAGLPSGGCETRFSECCVWSASRR